MTTHQAPLMPTAAAIWLIDNTALTFEQIAAFTGLHMIEIESLADGEGMQVKGQSPILTGELTKEEIARCEEDPAASLRIVRNDHPQPKTRAKGPRYTPVSKRGDKPDAIAWILKHHPELADSQIIKLIGTTKNTISSIRNKTHANMANIRARSPIELGLCRYDELEAAVDKARKKLEKEGKALPKSEAKIEEEMENENETVKGFDFSNFLGTGTNS